VNEAETRAEHIDPALAAAGWGVVEGSRIRREYPITLGRLEGGGKRGKPLTADYVLEYRNIKLAVVEAKAWDKALTEGVGQAKDYAGKLTVRFTYSTNGQALRRSRLQQDHRDQGTREGAGQAVHGADRPAREDAGVLRDTGSRAGDPRCSSTRSRPATIPTTASG
jgi:type I site-specific restriction endonuclease